MSRLPGRLPGHVDDGHADHLAGGTAGRNKGADSNAHPTDIPLLHNPRPAPASSPARVGRVALERMRSMLSEREMAVVESVDEFRYMSAGQIERLHFRSHASGDTAARIRRRVLERLTTARLLTRTERVIGGVRGGSAGFVYGIGPVGHKLLHDDRSRGRWEEPSLTFLDHTLAVAETAVRIIEGERDGSFEVLEMQAEPRCWRSFTVGLGVSEVLKPDLFVSVAEGDYEHRWFIEVDRGTESSRALSTKCHVYEAYRRTGVEQKLYEVFPRVLWVVPSEKRARQLRALVDKSNGLTAAMYAVVVDERIDDFRSLLAGGQS